MRKLSDSERSASRVGESTARPAEEWRAQTEQQSTRERVYAVAMRLYESMRVTIIAERADVAKETTREYLRWFAEIELVTPRFGVARHVWPKRGIF